MRVSERVHVTEWIKAVPAPQCIAAKVLWQIYTGGVGVGVRGSCFHPFRFMPCVISSLKSE